MGANWPWRFRRLGLSALVAWALAGCGGNGGPAGGDPAGNVIPGLGPVRTAAEARDRILRQYLGVTPAAGRAAETGHGADPLVRAYQIGSAPFANGTEIRLSAEERFRLNRPFYLFWIDPNPMALLGHATRLLYLAAEDGRIIERTVLLDPLVNGDRPLRFEQERQEQLIYQHELYAVLGSSNAPRRREFGRVRALSFGAAGLSVVGNDEGMLKADAATAMSFFEAIGGDGDRWGIYADGPGHQADKAGLEAAIEVAARGLGAGDKFFLHIAAHGEPEGRFWVGQEPVTWGELRAMLARRVHAGHINLLIGSCFGGTAFDAFEGWEEGGTSLHIVTATDATHSAYASNDGGIVGIECWLLKIYALLRQAVQSNSLTVAGIEDAFENAELTKEEIDAKIEAWRETLRGRLQEEFDQWFEDYSQDDGEEDGNRGNGVPGKRAYEPATTQEPVVLERSLGQGTGMLVDGTTTNLQTVGGSVQYEHTGNARVLSVTLQLQGTNTSATIQASGSPFLAGEVGDSPFSTLREAVTAPLPPGSLDQVEVVSLVGQNGQLVLLNPGVGTDSLDSLNPIVGLTATNVFVQLPVEGPSVAPGDVDLNGVDELAAGAEGTLTVGTTATEWHGLLVSRFAFHAWIIQLLGFTPDGRRLFATGRADLAPTAPADAPDLDRDGDVDLGDFEAFTACFTGPGGTVAPSAAAADLDHDGDVDLADLPLFQQALTGP